MSHYRGMTITWEVADDPNTLGAEVEFTIEGAWRSGAADSILFNFGDQSQATLSPTTLSTNSEFTTVRYTTSHTYSSRGNFEAFFTSGNRISTLDDGYADSLFRSETIVNIGTGNAAPVASLPAIIQVPDNGIFTLNIPGIDSDGDLVTFRFGTVSEFISGNSSTVVAPSGSTLTQTGLFTWDVRDSVLNVNPGDQFVLTVMVEDGEAKTPIDIILQIVGQGSGNVAPIFLPALNPGDQTVKVGQASSIGVQAQDTNLVSIQALNPAPGMTTEYHASHNELHVHWTPTAQQAGDIYLVSFQATDAAGATAQFTVKYTVADDGPTVVTEIADATISEDASFILSTASNFANAAGDPLSFGATLADGSALPSWLAIDAATGVLSGTPADEDVGEVEVTVTASDGVAQVASTFTLTVVNTNDAPRVTTAIPNQSASEAAVYSYDVSTNFADDDVIHGDVLSYSAHALPSWLAIDAATGVLSGTPADEDVGEVEVTVTASDGVAQVASTFTLTVVNTNDGPEVTVNGTSGDDPALIGTDGDDVIDPGAGSDTVNAGAGDDRVVLRALAGADSLELGAGVDVVSFSRSAGRDWGHTLITDFVAGNGGDQLDMAEWLLEELIGFTPGQNPFDTGHLILVFTYADTQVQVDLDGPGEEFEFRTLVTLQITNTTSFTYHNLPGFTHDGRLVGKSEGGIYGGGGGNDIEGDVSSNLLYGGAGDDRLEGLGGDDLLNGENGDDYVDGGDGDDLLAGGARADGLVGGPGADRMFGEAGDDTALGGEGDDLISSGEGVDYVEGGEGADVVNGGGDNDLIGGGDGVDVLFGEAADDMIYADGGNDYASGGSGDDVLYGGEGADGLSGGDGNDLLVGGDGDDALLGGMNADVAYGEGGADYLVGGEGDDSLSGQGGDDVIDGGQAHDALFGEEGDDILYGFDGNDYLSGGAGTDFSAGQLGNDTLEGEAGDDTLVGGLGGDGLLGGDGGDQLFGEADGDYLGGGAGVDFLDGGAGDDVLVGGSGGDRLVGGAGRDTFFFLDPSDSPVGSADRVVDFNPSEDGIALDRVDADTTLAGDQAFVIAAAFSRQAGQVVLTYDAASGTTLLQLDVDGDAAADLAVLFDGQVTGEAGFIL